MRKLLVAVLAAVSLVAASPAQAAIQKVGPCDFVAAPNQANAVTSIDGYVFHNATYLNAANYWYDVVYRPAWLAGTYQPCRVVTSLSLPLVVSGTVEPEPTPEPDPVEDERSSWGRDAL